MKVLIMTDLGNLNPFAHRLTKEGHDVRLFIFNELFHSSGQGLAKRVPSWRPSVSWCDLAIVDKEDFGAYEQVFRGAGKPVLGCARMLDFFREPDRLEKFADTIQVPIYMKEMGDGFEFTFSKWWNGRGWVEPTFTAVIDDTLFPFGVGPLVGPVGGLVVADPENGHANELFLRLTPMVRNSGYRGPVNISVSYVEEKLTLKGVHGGFLSGLVSALIEGLRVEVFDTLYDVAHGIAKRFHCIKKPIIWVTGTIPPFPYAGAIQPVMLPLGDLNDDMLKHMHLIDCTRGGGRWHCGGATGKLFEVTAMGEHCKEARRRAYRTFKHFDIPALQYRHDVGRQFERNVEAVSEFGVGTEEMAQCLAVT